MCQLSKMRQGLNYVCAWQTLHRSQPLGRQWREVYKPPLQHLYFFFSSTIYTRGFSHSKTEVATTHAVLRSFFSQKRHGSGTMFPSPSSLENAPLQPTMIESKDPKSSTAWFALRPEHQIKGGYKSLDFFQPSLTLLHNPNCQIFSKCDRERPNVLSSPLRSKCTATCMMCSALSRNELFFRKLKPSRAQLEIGIYGHDVFLQAVQVLDEILKEERICLRLKRTSAKEGGRVYKPPLDRSWVFFLLIYTLLSSLVFKTTTKSMRWLGAGGVLPEKMAAQLHVCVRAKNPNPKLHGRRHMSVSS